MSLDFHRGSLEAMSSEIELLKPSERTLSQCCKKNLTLWAGKFEPLNR